jgi:hypothetical protein
LIHFPKNQGRFRGIFESLEERRLLSSWFVSPAGSDQNPGTIAAPFKSIQHAATIAKAGDHVEIRAGVYHEEVTPANSGTPGNPIVFEAYNGEKVTITGADPITGWTKYSGNIYRAPMSWDLNAGNNEVFFDGLAGVEARWPNTSLSTPSTPAKATMQSVKIASPGVATIYDTALNQPAGFWQGAVLQMAPGQAWYNESATVTSSSPGSVTISYVAGDQYATPTAGNKFFLWGKLKALDAAGEWYRDPTTGLLYVWMPKSDSPLLHDVEVKKRVYAFDVSNVHDITIQGMSLFSSTIRTTSISNDIVVNRIYSKYSSESRLVPIGYWSNPTEGIFMRGANCVVENSTIAYSSGDGIVFSGIGGIINNNVVHDVDYVGTNCAGIRALDPSVLIEHNTVYNCGRHGIVAGAAGDTVFYNTIHDIGLQTTEAGGVYTVGVAPVGGTICYNQIYNIHSAGYGGTAIFLDNGSSGWAAYHNSTWNVDYALKMNFTSNNDLIYNNTLSATSLAINTNKLGNWDGVQIYNNIFLKPIVTTLGALITNNLYATTTNPAYGAGTFTSGAVGVPT